MNIILSFLTGAVILYIIVGSFFYLLGEQLHRVPKFFKLGAQIGKVIGIIFALIALIVSCYLLGCAILNNLI